MRRFATISLLSLACGSLGPPVTQVADSRTLLPAATMAAIAGASPKQRLFSDQAPFWDPSASELADCEANLRARWGGRRYDLQYFGTTDAGRRVLRVHGWCVGRIPLDELASFPVFTTDAGHCHFTAQCESGMFGSSLRFSPAGRTR